jgi:electron transport complex protein RnfG
MKGTGPVPGILKLGVILMIYAAAACVGLAFVYSATAEIIARRQQQDLEAALKELFPEADGFEDITGTIPGPPGGVTFIGQYEIRQGEAVIGAAIRASGGSYGGPIVILTGIGADGRISGVKIMEHQDTPGLGANAASPSYYVDKAAGRTFYGQFAGKSVTDPFEVKGDVAAISAATVTSRAVSSVVKACGEAAAAWFAGEKPAADAVTAATPDAAETALDPPPEGAQ